MVNNEEHTGQLFLEDNKYYYFDSFGGAPDNFLLNQPPKTFIYIHILIIKFKI